MKVLLAQTDIKLGDKGHNIDKAVEVLKSNSADLYLFPELFTTGFYYERLNELAEPLSGETVTKLAKECSKSMVGGTILEKEGGKVYNTFVLISNEGLLGYYRKIHPFKEEKKHFASGNEVKVIDTVNGKMGLSVCYDVRFPEVYRGLLKDGANIALISAEFPVPRQSHWDTLIKARAIENQFFVAAVNRVGTDDNHQYFGSSQVVDPWGNIMVKAGSKEELITVDIDFEEVDKIRKDFPVLEDRRMI